MRTWGIYSQWDAEAKQLPKIVEVTNRIPARIDIEFGFVVNIKGARSQLIAYCIDHPGILDDDGNCRLPFTGTVYAGSNDWDFFLGDTIWDPIGDKLGEWRLSLELDGVVIADQTFEVYEESLPLEE